MAPRAKKTRVTKANTKTNNKEQGLSSPAPSKSKKSPNTPSLVTPASNNKSKRRSSTSTSKGQSPGESSDGASPMLHKQMYPPAVSPNTNRMVTPMMINVPNNMPHPPPRLPSMPHQGSPNNRSPSPTGSNANTPRTTTSRRGGRSRSPSSHIRRANAPSPSMQNQKANDDFGNRPPSSAAAAAAAAAKALGNHHQLGPSQQWYGNGEEDEFHQHNGSPDPRGNYGRGAGRNAWPDQEQGPGYGENPETPSRFVDGSYMRGGSPPQGGNYPPEQDYRRRLPPHQYPRGGNPNQFDRYNQSPQDMRYNNNRRPRNEEEYYQQQQHRRNMTPSSARREADYYNNREDGAGSPASIMTAKRSGAGGSKREGGSTKGVIGTSTPIHVPRAASSSSLASSQRSNSKGPQAGTPASVFRGRPANGRNEGNQPSSDDSDDNSPQKILLSLRTPTKSFDNEVSTKRKNEKSKNKKRSNAAAGGKPNSQPPPESPQEPPRIQHSHHQSHMSPNSLFFDPRQNPKQQQQNEQQQSPSEQMPPNANPAAPTGIEMAPSFNLFNNSFDSLGDTAHYLSNVGPGPFDSSLVNSQSFGVNPSQSFAGTNGPDGEGRKPHQQQEPGEPLLRQGSAGAYLSASASKGGVASFGLNLSATHSFGNQPPMLDLSRSGEGVRSMLLGGGTVDEQDTEGGGQMVVRQSPSSSGRGSPMGVQSEAAAAAGAAAQDIYRSYSNGGVIMNQQRGSPFRMRNEGRGMGGGPMGRMDSSGDAYGAAPGNYHPHGRGGPPPYHGAHPDDNRSGGSLSFVRQPSFSQHSPQRNRIPGFYFVLCRYKNAFKNCTFLLPGLKRAMKTSDDEFLQSMGRGGLRGNSSGGYTPSRREIDRSPFRSDRDMHEFTPAPSNTPTRSRRRFPDPSPTETEIAMRRVASSICAFGGSSSANVDMTNKPSKVALTGPDSIFRTKDSEDGGSLAVSVTLSSSALTKHARRVKSQARIKYEEALPNRYYENESRLSWEFEESPPVQSAPEGEDASMPSSGRNSNDEKPTASGSHKRAASEDTNKDEDARPSKKSKTTKEDKGDDDKTSKDDDNKDAENEGAKDGEDPSPPSPDKKSDADGEEKKDTPKIKYRCKLCGQPKQNHSCPYRQSLQRSIGVMIYPAVNAFTSSEPGLLAPALSDMNNFVSSSSEMLLSETSPSRSTPDRPTDASAGDDGMSMPAGGGPSSSPPNVTPETLRTSVHAGSPGSSLSGGVGGSPQGTPFRTRGRKNETTPATRSSHLNYAGGARMSASQTPGSNIKDGPDSSHISVADTSSSGESSSTDLLFVDAMELKPEQYRIVTPKSAGSMDPNAYSYPPLPLPYAQRKRLSDNLFAMSKEIPHLTDECAVVLREAREKDMWDVAVAQLMTQVVVVVHCPEGDNRLDGLRQYLLTLGIAC